MVAACWDLAGHHGLSGSGESWFEPRRGNEARQRLSCCRASSTYPPAVVLRQNPSKSLLGVLPHEPRQLGADLLYLGLERRLGIGAQR